MTCPICQRPTQQTFRPFCSKYCADVDLGRWFQGNYRTPSFRQDNEENTSLSPKPTPSGSTYPDDRKEG